MHWKCQQDVGISIWGRNGTWGTGWVCIMVRDVGWGSTWVCGNGLGVRQVQLCRTVKSLTLIVVCRGPGALASLSLFVFGPRALALSYVQVLEC